MIFKVLELPVRALFVERALHVQRYVALTRLCLRLALNVDSVSCRSALGGSPTSSAATSLRDRTGCLLLLEREFHQLSLNGFFNHNLIFERHFINLLLKVHFK